MTRCPFAVIVACAAWSFVNAGTSAFGQAYHSSRYAESSNRAWPETPATYGYDSWSGTARLAAPGHSIPYDDYRSHSSGDPRLGSIAPLGPSWAQGDPAGMSSRYAGSPLPQPIVSGSALGTCPQASIADDPGPSGAVWSEPFPMQPHWSVRAGAIALRRNRASSQPFTDGATPTNAADFDPGYQVGPQVNVIYRDLGGTPWGVEVGFFTIDGFQDQTFTPVASQLFTVPPINFAPMDVTSEFDSSVTSGEINARYEWSEWTTFLGGFRYFEVQDDLLHRICMDGGTVRIESENRAYGLQLGAEGYIFKCCRFEVGGWSKAVLLLNSAEQVTTTTLLPGLVPLTSASDERITYLGDAGLAATYRLTNWLAVRGGYRMLWLDAAATAASQMLSTDLVSGAAAINFGSSLFYHGGFGGAELTW